MCLGQAKHEPCGEHWDASYGETAWRMAVAALCLPPGRCNRARLVRVALSSALTCVGSRTDHCSEWKDKGCFHMISRVHIIYDSVLSPDLEKNCTDFTQNKRDFPDMSWA